MNLISKKSLLICVIGLVIGIINSCNKDGDEIADGSYNISGPDNLKISKLGRGVQGTFTFDGTSFKNPPYWRLTTPSQLGKVEESFWHDSFKYKFAIPGEYRLDLYTNKISNELLATKYITVEAPPPLDESYDLPLLLLVLESKLPTDGPSHHIPTIGVYTLDPETKEMTKLFSSDRLYDDRINWSPSGESFVFTLAPPERNYPETPFKIYTYSLRTGKISQISNNTSGLAWKATWSPKGDWIAYTDDSNSLRKSNMTGDTVRYSYDEILLIRPDGTERFYLRGEGDIEHIMAHGPGNAALALSWDPTGKKLVANAGNYTQRRLKVHDNIFESNLSSTFLPTNEQLDRFYDKNELSSYLTREDFLSSLIPGTNGIAWSPDGQYLLYTLNYGYSPAFNSIAISRADGSGDIEELSAYIWNEGDFWIDFAHSPTWSMDGTKCYYTVRTRYKHSLFEVDLEGDKIPKDITPEGFNVCIVSLFD